MNIISTKELVENFKKYEKSTIMLKCKIKTIPQKSPRLDEKFISELDTSEVDKKAICKLTIWKNPTKISHEGSKLMWELFENTTFRTLFSLNEDLIVKGIPIKSFDDVIWFNITNVVIGNPDILIGPREIEAISTCDRYYYLQYVKNIGGNDRINIKTHLTRGNLVHKTIEYLVETEKLKDFFDESMSNPERETLLRDALDEVIQQYFKLDFVSLRFSREKDRYTRQFLKFHEKVELIISESLKNLQIFFQIPELGKIINNASNIRCEEPLDSFFGFLGQIDLLIDDLPIEIKTSSRAHYEHEIQMSIYLLKNAIVDKPINGILIYTNPDFRGDRAKKITLNNKKMEQIIYLRHKAILLRSQIYLPSTHEKNCENCHLNSRFFRTVNDIFNRPCQYYCSIERFWNCYKVKDNNIISKCKLFNECDLKSQYFDMELIDSYNKLRSLLKSESEAIEGILRALSKFPKDMIEKYGQTITTLRYSKHDIREVIFSRKKILPALDIVKGEKLVLTINKKSLDKIAEQKFIVTFVGASQDEIHVHFESNIPRIVFNKNIYFNLEKQYFEIVTNRKLLKIIDYLQRAKDEFPTGLYSDNQQDTTIEPFSIEKLRSALANSFDSQNKELNEEYFIQIPPSNETNYIKGIQKILSECINYGRVLVIADNLSDANKIASSFSKSGKIMKIVSRDNYPEKGEEWDITKDDMYDELKTKLLKSQVIITIYDFVFNDHFFNTLTGRFDKYFFESAINLRAERLINPEVTLIKSLARKMIWVGDSLLVGKRYKSKQMRFNEQSTRYFSKLVNRATRLKSGLHYFYKKEFSNINPIISNLFQELGYSLSSKKSSVEFSQFYNITSHERKFPKEIILEYQLRIEPLIRSYIISIVPLQKINPEEIPPLMKKLEKQNIESKDIGSKFELDNVLFEITQKDPLIVHDTKVDRFHNVVVRVVLSEDISDSLSELLLENIGEADQIVELLKQMEDKEDVIVVTPFLAQVSLLKKKIADSNLSIPVGTPLEFAGQTFKIAILSTVCSNKYEVVHWPLTSLHHLYTMLTIANEEIILVGNKKTIRHIQFFRRLIESIENV